MLRWNVVFMECSIHGTPETCLSNLFYPLACGTDFQAVPYKKISLTNVLLLMNLCTEHYSGSVYKFKRIVEKVSFPDRFKKISQFTIT